MGNTPRDKWPVRAGDFERYTIELHMTTAEAADTDEWRLEFRPAPLPEEEHIDAAFDDSLLGNDPPEVSFTLEGSQITTRQDGWIGDIAYLDANGKPDTLVEIELAVEDQYTE